MATIKTVQIEAKMDNAFKIQGKLRDHVIYADQPTQAGGQDSGPTPLEYLLFSLAACIASIGRIVANQRKINLRSMELKVKGQLDLEALMGKSQETRPGFGGITVTAKIDADLSQEEKEEFLHEVDSRCPVSDNIINSTPISLELEQ